MTSDLTELQKTARDLSLLVQAYRTGVQLDVPAATMLELESTLDSIDESEAYAGDLLGVAVAFIADPRARTVLKEFGLELGE